MSASSRLASAGGLATRWSKAELATVPYFCSRINIPTCAPTMSESLIFSSIHGCGSPSIPETNEWKDLLHGRDMSGRSSGRTLREATDVRASVNRVPKLKFSS